MKPIMLIAIALLLSGCIKSTPSEKIGTWCESDDGGQTCYGVTSYFSDGSIYADMYLQTNNARYIADGIWFHRLDKSCVEITRIRQVDSETGHIIKDEKPFSFCNTTISLTQEVFEYSRSNGEVSKMYRLSSSPNKSIQPTAIAAAD